MKVELIGHDEKYALEQSLLTLFPGEKPVYGTVDETADAHWVRVTLTAESGELMRMNFAAENSGDLHVNADAVFTDASAPVVPDGGALCHSLVRRRRLFFHADRRCAPPAARMGRADE